MDTLKFSERDINSIIIPKHVKEIGREAFHSCKNLTTVEFSPESELTEIGENSFSESGINSITIPKHVKKIGFSAFSYCRKLTTVNFSPESELTEISEYSFSGCSIAIPNTNINSFFLEIR